ncbi:VOC family protein [Levilactobacillus yiduensis]|uniref:VOC family protein n=1 Tax=Levilactobacillus yiduensis TaxID=2953880 RepID=UPI000EF2BA16|nr:VOC family protein [Levilactobacillus yiduensis]AYM02352.1 glyoxalase [Levilactobacillus brevis]
MMQKTRIMLYVRDVDLVVKFWQETFDLPVVATTPLPDGSRNVVLALDAGTELSFFSRAFIQQVSPEVADNVPSLLLFSDHFEALHAKIAAATPIDESQGQPTFSFPDPEGTYFAVAKAMDADNN